MNLSIKIIYYLIETFNSFFNEITQIILLNLPTQYGKIKWNNNNSFWNCYQIQIGATLCLVGRKQSLLHLYVGYIVKRLKGVFYLCVEFVVSQVR